MADEAEKSAGRPAKAVRAVIGANIKRIRELRGWTVRDLSAQLKEVGFQLSPSGVSEVELATRKIGADELLIFAIALNTSVIDLLSPVDGSDLLVTEGLRQIHPWWLEKWMRGETPPWRTSKADLEAFYETAPEHRRAAHAISSRPDMAAIAYLEALVREDIESMGYIFDPKKVAEGLRRQLSRVSSYVELLAEQLDESEPYRRPGQDGG